MRPRSQRGFTILEVMLAAFVMVLAITTSIIAMQRAFCGLDIARKITLAGQVMQSELEKIRLEDWAAIAAYPASTDITAAAAASFGASGAIANSFTLNRAVADVHTDMRQITLTTTWRTIDGRSMSRSYTTYYGRNGLYDYFYNSY